VKETIERKRERKKEKEKKNRGKQEGGENKRGVEVSRIKNVHVRRLRLSNKGNLYISAPICKLGQTSNPQLCTVLRTYGYKK